MKEILKKKEKRCVSKEEFCSDVEVLFAELKNSYGGYDYFGENAFLNAKQAILEKANAEYDFEKLESFMIEEFSKFIKDGYFSINDKCVFFPQRTNIYKDENKSYDYAVRTYEVDGIPVFDIKKFYYDNDEEQVQLDTFAKSGERYKDAPCLIFDLRQNIGGSDTYLCDFLEGLNGEEPDFPMDFRQIYSDTFVEWLANECDMHGFEQNIDEMGGFAPDIYGAFEVEDVVRIYREV